MSYNLDVIVLVISNQPHTMKLAKFDITCPIIIWIVLHSVRATINKSTAKCYNLDTEWVPNAGQCKKIMKTLNGGQYKIDT